jgi:hypothetical protein
MDDESHSSLTLLERAQAGDRAALESLVARYLPRQTFKRIEKFESRGEGALQAYLRQAILNRRRSALIVSSVSS